jgi:hypothetical protein
MGIHRIETPRGTIIQTDAGTATLEWNPGFGPRASGRFNAAQEFIDSEVLRACSSRVPFQTGFLQKSGILGSEIGSGELSYLAPYAGIQYYRTAPSRSYDANRGGMWFERAKAAEGRRILAGAARIAGSS